MTRYKNLSGNSGIHAYEAGSDFIKIRFADGVYLYDYNKPGKIQVEEMKMLAVKGIGLATYINTRVRGNYSSKIG